MGLTVLGVAEPADASALGAGYITSVRLPDGTTKTFQDEEARQEIQNILSQKYLKPESVKAGDNVFVTTNEAGEVTISASGGCVATTYSNLKNLRTNKSLVPGTWYRITDYVATTNGDMSSQSAKHPFDILVLATADDALSEQALAMRHAGDTYFPSGTKFEAWRIWYCLDNDTSRFAWASAYGKGVIYRMVDEFANDAPYDFKGIQFIAYDDFVYRYTFDSGNARGNTDYSLNGGEHDVYGNSIEVHGGAAYHLNCIVFRGNGCNSNTFGNNCRNITFGKKCRSNTFANECRCITFGNNCFFNTFGEECRFNTFGNSCCYNTFGDEFYHNVFGNHCRGNRVAGDWGYHKVGDEWSCNVIDGKYENLVTYFDDVSGTGAFTVVHPFRRNITTVVSGQENFTVFVEDWALNTLHANDTLWVVDCSDIADAEYLPTVTWGNVRRQTFHPANDDTANLELKEGMVCVFFITEVVNSGSNDRHFIVSRQVVDASAGGGSSGSGSGSGSGYDSGSGY